MMPRFRGRGFYEGTRRADGPQWDHIRDVEMVLFLIRFGSRWVAIHAPPASRYDDVMDMFWDPRNFAFRSSEYIMQPGPHTWEAPRGVVRVLSVPFVSLVTYLIRQCANRHVSGVLRRRVARHARDLRNPPLRRGLGGGGAAPATPGLGFSGGWLHSLWPLEKRSNRRAPRRHCHGKWRGGAACLMWKILTCPNFK